MPNQTMVYSCSAPEQEYTMAWPGILLHLLISSLKIRFCEQSVFAKSPLQGVLYEKGHLVHYLIYISCINAKYIKHIIRIVILKIVIFRYSN